MSKSCNLANDDRYNFSILTILIALMKICSHAKLRPVTFLMQFALADVEGTAIILFIALISAWAFLLSLLPIIQFPGAVSFT